MLIRGPIGFAALLAFAVLLAACDGLGTSSLFPSEGSAQANLTGAQGDTRRTVLIHVPAAAQQQPGRRPFQLAPGSQAIGIAAVPMGSAQSPSPASLQMVTFGASNPCIQSAGASTCQIAVQASPGADVFYVDAFADASPGPAESPAASFISSPVLVPGAPLPGATPLTLSLNAAVASIAIAVPSPAAPGANTQLFTVATPSAWQPLIVTAQDANGAPVLFAPGAPLASPVPISVTPANEGVALALASQCGSPSSTSAHPAASVTIACAADFAQLQFGYTGTVAHDQNARIVDTFAIAAAQAASPAPSPAIVGLSSALVTATPLPGLAASTVLLARTNGKLAFLAGDASSWRIGTIDPVTLAATSYAFAAAAHPRALAIAPNGTLWIADRSALECFPSLSAASGTPLTPRVTVANGDRLDVTNLTIDANGVAWFTGSDATAHAQAYAGDFSVAGGCGAVRAVTARYLLQSDLGDSAPSIAPLAGGGAAIGSSSAANPNGVYLVTSSSRSSIAPMPAALTGASNAKSAGIASDAAGNLYASFVVANSDADIESATAGSALTTLLAVPPTNIAEGASAPFGMTGFAPSTAIDRLLAADSAAGAIDLIENVPASPMPVLVVPTPGATLGAVAYGPSGDEYAAYVTGATQSAGIARVLATTYWSIPNTTIGTPCSSAGIVGILERDDSSPFTIAFPNGGGSAAPFAGTTHDFWVTLTSPNVPALVSDAHGRTQSVTFNDAYTGAACTKLDSSRSSTKQAP